MEFLECCSAPGRFWVIRGSPRFRGWQASLFVVSFWKTQPNESKREPQTRGRDFGISSEQIFNASGNFVAVIVDQRRNAL
jgi:hypothetical protein